MKAIASFLKYRPKKEFIIKSGLPWLQLDIDVPARDIFSEFIKIEDQLVLHREQDKFGSLTHNGWKSATLYGVSTTQTTDSNKLHTWTDLANSCPITVNWIKENFIVNEKTGRIRFMFLPPGGYILPHKDRDSTKLSEINIAITNPKGCVFRFMDRGTIPFASGTGFIIDTSNKHMVFNDSQEPRLHMILHTEVSNEIIERSYEKCYYST